MNPLAAKAPRDVYGVKWLTSYLLRRIEDDAKLRDISIRGEVSNFKRSGWGNVNFDLGEDGTLLRCYAGEQEAYGFPEFGNGAKVIASGYIGIYPPRGTYQLIVRAVRLEGIGDVHALFEKRKRKLAAEGLFDPARKRPLPRYPFRIALVSSRRAQGARDFVDGLRRSRPHVGIALCETSVQGPNAANEIAGALDRASQLDVDAIVIARGGGSFEDLFAFSDETVVRAVVRARHPVVSAVGHTVDQQLSDFAADVLADTPSFAVDKIGLETRVLREGLADRVKRARETVTRDVRRRKEQLLGVVARTRLADPSRFLSPARQHLDDLVESLERGTRESLRAKRDRLASLEERLRRHDPRLRLLQRGEALRLAQSRLERIGAERFESWRRVLGERQARLAPAARAVGERSGQRLELRRARLEGNNPEGILQKGYAIVSHEGRIVRDARDVPVGARIEARLARGTLEARVEAEKTDGNERSG